MMLRGELGREPVDFRGLARDAGDAGPRNENPAEAGNLDRASFEIGLASGIGLAGHRLTDQDTSRRAAAEGHSLVIINEATPARKGVERSPSVDRLPPRDVGAERSVLGSILRDNTCLHEVVPILMPEDFHVVAHQVLYRAILHLYDLGRPIDALILAEELEGRGEYEQAGGDWTLVDILDAAPHALDAVRHARTVLELSVRRQIIEVVEAVIRECYAGRVTAAELVEWLDRRIDWLRARLAEGGGA